MTEKKRPVVLCILDGWGKRAETDANAIALGNTPNWDRMIETWPTGELLCSGADVGLPDGQMGNSEVGHMNIGAGRVVWQDLPRINNAIADGTLAKSPALNDFITKLQNSGGTCHLLGLLSDGGVHAHQDHILALAKIVAGAGIPVKVHAFTDGRDTAPESAHAFLQTFDRQLTDVPNARIATVCGRFFAMDRDNRWERVQKAYDLMMTGNGQPDSDAASAAASNYQNGITDEFIEPTDVSDHAATGMQDGDGLLSANFRADRMREILAALLDPAFDGFTRQKTVNFAAVLGMVSYSDHLDQFLPTIFPLEILKDTIGETVALNGKHQLRLAETEKYPHVTFFLNGGQETPFENEHRVLVPSPKVATYDLQPEMSAPEVTDHLIKAIRDRQTDLIIVNYANGDMVGHTGSLDAAIAAVEYLDSALGRVETAILDAGGTMLITADHGNCETMVDPETGGPHTAHTLNPVPTVLVNHPEKNAILRNGRLADLAPTLLEIMDVEQPADMTGQSLVVA